MSPHSPVKDLNTLRFHYDLPTIFVLREAIEIASALEYARNKDIEEEDRRNSP